MSDNAKGLMGGLTNYGDPDFARYLRRSFAKSMGYTGAALDKPIVGICTTESGFNNCHRHFPELVGLGQLVLGWVEHDRDRRRSRRVEIDDYRLGQRH